MLMIINEGRRRTRPASCTRAKMVSNSESLTQNASDVTQILPYRQSPLSAGKLAGSDFREICGSPIAPIDSTQPLATVQELV